MRCYYTCKYYFNSSHSFNGKEEFKHSHTFTLLIYFGKRRDVEVDIKEVDDEVYAFLKKYEDCYLNDLSEFREDASLEAIGNVFYEDLKEKFRKTKFSLYQLDIYENPLNVYRVADRILLPTLNMENSKTNYDLILKQIGHLQKKG